MSGEIEPALAPSVARAIDVLRLTPQPGVLRWAIERCVDGRDDDALVEAAAHDPVLAARVIALCPPDRRDRGDTQHRKPLDIRQAARQVGGGALYALVQRAAADWLQGVTGWSERSDVLGAFWAHSIHCAHLASSLAEVSGYPSPEEAYTAGLLHDLGITVLMAHAPSISGGLLASSISEQQLAAKESEHFGFSHADLGDTFLSRLPLPGPVRDALLLHHAPPEDLAGTHALVRILWVAETLCNPTAPASGEDRIARLVGVGAAEIAHAAALAARRTRGSAQTLGIASARIALWAPAAMSEPAGSHALVPQFDTQNETRTRAALMDAMLLRAVLSDAPAILFESSDEHTLLAHTLSLGTAMFGLARLAVFLYERDRNELSGWHVGDRQLRDTELRVPELGGINVNAVTRAWVDRKPAVLLPGKAMPLRGVDLQLARLLGTPGLAAVPLASGSLAFGVLVWGVEHPQASRLPREQWALSRLAGLAAVALARLRTTAHESQTRNSEAAERLGQAIRRLVHEARNPLASLKTQLELLRERVRDAVPVDHEIQLLQEEIDRVGGILGRLSKLESPSEPVKSRFNVNRLIQDVLALYREPLFAARGIAVQVDLPSPGPDIVAHADGLRQVLLNLLKNASEAMHEGGQLRIAVTDAINHEGALMVEISISDTGPGLPRELQENPFVQAPGRAGKEGRGYGLSNSYAIVRQAGGRISCHSQAGRGTTFSVLMPRAGRGVAEPA